MRVLEGWIFDVYTVPQGVRLWILDDYGRCFYVLDPWQPSFFLSGSEPELRRALALLRTARHPVDCRPARRTELFSGEKLDVLEVRVPPPAHAPWVKRLGGLGFKLYNADIHLAQAYHYERGHFPLARCRFEIEKDVLRGWELLDSPWNLDYALPPLRFSHLALTGSEIAGRSSRTSA